VNDHRSDQTVHGSSGGRLPAFVGHSTGSTTSEHLWTTTFARYGKVVNVRIAGGLNGSGKKRSSSSCSPVVRS